MQRSTPPLLPAIIIALGVVGLTGCGSAEKDATPPAETSSSTEKEEATEQPKGEGEGIATFTFGDATYTANLAECALFEADRAEFHGPVNDDAGAAVGYIDGEFAINGADASGEARIDFGATEPGQSTDEFLAIGDAKTHIVVADFTDSNWYLVGGAWDHTDTVTAASTLQISCE